MSAGNFADAFQHIEVGDVREVFEAVGFDGEGRAGCADLLLVTFDDAANCIIARGEIMQRCACASLPINHFFP
jgi:hypothetical protein